MFLPTFKRCAALFLAVILLLALCSACTEQQSTDKPQTTQTTQTTRPTTPTPEASYAAALAALAEKNYTEAHALLSALGDYKDAPALLEKFVFRPTEIKADNGDTVTLTYDENGNCTRIVCDYIKVIYTANGKWQTKKNTSVEYTYGDVVGQPVQTTTKREGEVESVAENTYDENGRLTMQSGTEYDRVFSAMYQYDDSGRLVRCDKFSVSGSGQVEEYIYDEDGKLIRQTSTDNYGNSEVKYEYDDNGNCIKKTSSMSGSEYEYDDNGNRTKAKHHNVFDDITKNMTYTYEWFYFEDGVPGNWDNFVNTVYDEYS